MKKLSHISLLVFLLGFALCASNPYQVLGVSRHASDQQIKKAFKDLSLKHHPDMAGQGNEQVYADIVNAYELLKDKERRRQYDLTGSTDENAGQGYHQGAGFGGFAQEGFINLNDIFREFHRQMGQQQQNQRKRFEQQQRQQQQQSQRNQQNFFDFNNEDYEVVNFIDEYGRMRMAVVRKQTGLFDFLTTLIWDFFRNPFQFLFAIMMLFFLCTSLVQINN